MKKLMRVLGVPVVFGLALVVSACGFDGGPIITDDIVTVVDDTTELSLRVKSALRNSPRTAILNINVMSVSEDSVKLSGFVPNNETIHEVERVASQVEGVRFVVNSLVVR